MENTEIWKDVIGYEGIYRISDLGNVFIVKSSRLKFVNVANSGYRFAALSKNGKTKNFYIHRLVATHFIPNPENKPYVGHIDNNQINNCQSNLGWCTQQENMDHAKSCGRVMANENHYKTKLNKELVLEIYNKISQGIETNALALEYGITSKLCVAIASNTIYQGTYNLTPISFRRKPRGNRIRCIETNQVFNSIASLSNTYNLNRSAISRQLKGKGKTVGGYTFELV